MLWGAPAALLLLLGAVPLILFLHSLKPKGRKVRTTTLFLWERVLKERPLGTRLGWLLRNNLLLLLQLIAAMLLIVALADPSLLQIGASPGDAVVVFDLSASMKARGGAGSRLDAAQKEFLRLIDGLSARQKMMLIGAGTEPRLILPFTSDKKRLRDAAHNISGTDAPGNVRDAIVFAHTFLKRGTSDHIVVISDGAFSGAEDFSRSAPHLRFIQIGGGNDNVGIVAFELRRYLHEPARLEILVRVKNYTGKRLAVPLTLSRDEEPVRRELMDMPAGSERVLIAPYSGAAAGTLRARLDVRDDFATDNQAYLALRDRPPLRLLYVGPGNPFVSNLVKSFSDVEFITAARLEEAGAPANAFDVIVFDRVPVPALAEGNVIVIGTLPENGPVRLAGKVANPRILAPLLPHPLTEGLNLADVRISQALRLAVTGKGDVLARSAETPLLFAHERGKLRLLLIGFDLAASDLPLRVAFPVLFHNVLEWFEPRRREFPAESMPAGTPFPLRLRTGAGSVELTTPSGKREVYQSGAGGVVLADTSEAGIHQYRSAKRAGSFAVNLLDEAESQIAPRWNLGASRDDQTDRTSEGLTHGFPVWPLLLTATLIVLGVELWLAFRASISLYPTFARLAALSAIGLALINPKLLQQTIALDVVLGVDLSRSVGNEPREKAREVLEIARRVSTPETRTGLLFFGRGAEWEFLPRRDFSIGEFTGRPDREETDIQRALQAVAAQMDRERQKRILLISDGNENRGELARVVPLLRAEQAQVWTLPATIARAGNEMYLSDLAVPQRVDSAETFEITAAIETMRRAVARIKMLRDGHLQAEQEIDLRPGTNTVSFREQLRQRGAHTYEVTVESEDDTLAENNLLQAVVEVKGAPRVLVLSTRPESQRFIARALEIQGYETIAALPKSHSLSLTELASFDLLVLDDVPAFQLGQAQMDNIERYVRDIGGGLLVVGGSQSYGAGGYYRTPLERILPLDMRPPARLDFPHVALLFLLDKSGSMGAGPDGSTKLDLAKAAAIAAADVMNPTDQVGILAFDAAWDWALPFRQVGKGEWISDRLAELQSDGGTDLYKAMVEAHRVIAEKQAAIKHVIVLSDGLTDKADFQGLVEKMARDNITLSTVSVGNDADVQLMADLAQTGKGRGYVALDPETVPQIFTAETLLVARDLLVEKPIAPSVVAPVGPLRGIAERGLPSLGGYVLTYPKTRAEMLMKAGEDPLLISWRYGLGRVTAFTSDLSGRWGRQWVSWDGFPRWAGQLARDAMRKLLETSAQTEFKVEEDYVSIRADLISGGGDFLNHLKLKANVVAPDGTVVVETLQQSAPGRYAGRFIPSRRGIHFLTLHAEGENGAASVPVGTFTYVAPYPKEYRELKPNLAVLSRLAEATGGEMLDAGKLEEGVRRLYMPAADKTTSGKETWWPLSAAALLFFIADLVLRAMPGRAFG